MNLCYCFYIPVVTHICIFITIIVLINKIWLIDVIVADFPNDSLKICVA